MTAEEIEAKEVQELIDSFLDAPRLDLVIQPLDEEPDVAPEATKIFLSLASATVDGDLSILQSELLATHARHIALILHGYYRQEVSEEEQMARTWDIFLQWQAMPKQCETFTVHAANQEGAIAVAQDVCEEKNGSRGFPLAVNGIPVGDN